MRRLPAFMLLLCLSVLSLRADADDGDWRRHDDRNVLKLFDAQGRLIGRVASFSGNDGVFLTVDGALVFAQITRYNPSPEEYDSAKYQWSTYGPFNYTTADCSGTPIIVPNSSPRPAIAVRNGADVTLLIAGDTDSKGVQIVAVFNGMQCTPPPTIAHMPPSTAPVPAFTAETSYPLTQHYPEPLTIRY